MACECGLGDPALLKFVLQHATGVDIDRVSHQRCSRHQGSIVLAAYRASAFFWIFRHATGAYAIAAPTRRPTTWAVLATGPTRPNMAMTSQAIMISDAWSLMPRPSHG